MAKDSHHDVANLDLSAEKVRVGWYEHDDNSIYIQIDDAPEPAYMSAKEARLLIAALKVAISKTREDRE